MAGFVGGVPASPALRRILEAAIAEFGEHGIEGTRMASIAQRAGLSKELIYYYYKNKEGLYREVLDNITIEMHQPILDFDFDCLSPLKALEAFFGMILDINMDAHHIFLADQMLHSGGFVKDSSIIYTLGRQVRTILEEIIRRGQSDGVVGREADASLLYLQINLLSSGFKLSQVVMSKYIHRDFELREAAVEWKEHVLKSMLATVSPRGAT